MRVHYEIYGCAVMRGEALNTLERLRELGFLPTTGKGDVAVIFTCTVRSETEQRMLARIENLLREYERVVVTGCLASAQPGLIKKMFPRVAIVSNGRLHEIERAISGSQRYLLGYSRPNDFLKTPPSSTILIVPIADGCLGNCTFCITKAARPILKSYSVESILNYIKEGIKKGAKEIWITAPDAAAYGKDLGTSLTTLMHKVLDVVPEDVTIRIGMMNPDTFYEIIDDMFEVFDDPRVYKFFHLPLQSASNKILKLMGRKYTYEEYVALINEIRKRYLDPTIATDILVGFPSEDEEDFNTTLEALRELAFERVHVAAYTPRPLTIGARMKQVREDVKSQRVKKLYSVMMKIGEEVHKRYVGGTFKARVIEYDEKHKTYVARLHNYVPVILNDKVELGGDAYVKIEGYTFYDLRGSVVQQLSRSTDQVPEK